MCVSEKNISRGLSLEIGPYYFETKSKSEAHSWKHSFRNTFEFVILGTKNQMKGLRKAYSPIKTTKVSWVWSEISLSETGSSIFSTKFFLHTNYFFEFSQYRSTVIFLLTLLSL